MLTKEIRDDDIEWVGKVPKDWELRRLKYILTERKQKNDPIITDNILSLSIERGVFPYNEKIGGGNKAKSDLTAYKVTYPNDIVINSMNIIAGSVGLSQYKGVVSPVYYTLYSNDKNINIEYFYLMFKTEVFQKSLLGLGNGILIKESSTGKLNTIRMRIPMNKLANVYLPVPPKEIQDKIVNHLTARLNTVNKIIKKTNQSIEGLKKYKQSLITEAVTKGLDLNVGMKNSEVEWIGRTPYSWRVIKLNQLFTIKKNIANDTGYDVLSVTQNGLRVRDITRNEGQMSADYSKYQIVEKHDFVMNHMDLLTGWIDIAKQQGVTSPDYRVFYNKQNDLVLNEYFLYVFQTAYTSKVFYGLGQGVSNVGRWRLQTDKFLNFYVPLPSFKEQQDIVSYLNQQTFYINKLIEDKTKIIERLEDYKGSIIYEYVTGKANII